MALLDNREERLKLLEKEKLRDPKSLSRVLMNSQLEFAGILSDRSALLKQQMANIQRQQENLGTIGKTAIGGATLSQAAPLILTTTAVKPLTQLVLLRYGFNPLKPQESSTKVINLPPIRLTLVSGTTTNNIKTENLTVYNNRTTNEIKIIQPLIPIQLPQIPVKPLGDSGRALRNWISGLMQQLALAIEVSKKEYQRKDWELSKSANKMLRKIEDASKRFAENMNPQRIAQAAGDQMKMVMMIVATVLLASGFGPITRGIDNLSKFFKGGEGEEGFFDKIKYMLGGEKGDTRGIGEIIKEGFMSNAEYITKFFSEEFEDRKKAIEKVLLDHDVKSFSSGVNKVFSDLTKGILDWGDSGNIATKWLKQPLASLGASLLNGFKSIALGFGSGTSFMGDLAHAAIGGSSGLSSYRASGIMGQSRELISDGQEEWVDFNGNAKKDYASTHHISHRLQELGTGEYDEKTGTVNVRTSNVILGINSLSNSTYDVLSLTSKGNPVTLHGTVVEIGYLLQFIPKKYYDELTRDSNVQEGGPGVSIYLIYAETPKQSWLGLTFAKKDQISDHNTVYGSNWLNTGFLGKTFTAVPDDNHTYKVALVTKKGWTRIKKYFGGENGLNLSDADDVLRINQSVANALGYENAKTKSVSYNSETKSYDDVQMTRLNEVSEMSAAHEARRSEMDSKWHQSTGYAAISHTGETMTNAWNTVSQKVVEYGKDTVDYLKDRISNRGFDKGRINTVIDYFKNELGLTDEQAAGFAGVLYAESGLNPHAYNKKEKAGTFEGSRANGSGYGAGLALWSNDRKKKILDHLRKTTGKNLLNIEDYDLEDQLEAIVWEMKNSRPVALEKLIGSRTSEEAADIILRGFENGSSKGLASVDDINKYTWAGGYNGSMYGPHGRAVYAAKILSLYKGDGASNGVPGKTGATQEDILSMIDYERDKILGENGSWKTDFAEYQKKYQSENNGKVLEDTEESRNLWRQEVAKTGYTVDEYNQLLEKSMSEIQENYSESDYNRGENDIADRGWMIAGGGANWTFDVGRAIDNIHNNSKPKSTGWCARHVSDALIAGGIKLTKLPSAKWYQGYLPRIGFSEILSGSKNPKNPNALPPSYIPQPGDVVVIDPNDKHPYGHIAMFDGLNWYSDYKQRTWHGLSGAAYNSYKIWRYDPSKTNMSTVYDGTNLPRAELSPETRNLLDGFKNGTNQYLPEDPSGLEDNYGSLSYSYDGTQGSSGNNPIQETLNETKDYAQAQVEYLKVIAKNTGATEEQLEAIQANSSNVSSDIPVPEKVSNELTAEEIAEKMAKIDPKYKVGAKALDYNIARGNFGGSISYDGRSSNNSTTNNIYQSAGGYNWGVNS